MPMDLLHSFSPITPPAHPGHYPEYFPSPRCIPAPNQGRDPLALPKARTAARSIGRPRAHRPPYSLVDTLLIPNKPSLSHHFVPVPNLGRDFLMDQRPLLPSEVQVAHYPPVNLLHSLDTSYPGYHIPNPLSPHYCHVPSPNLGSDHLLDKRLHKPKDQKGNRNQEIKRPFNKDKYRNWH